MRCQATNLSMHNSTSLVRMAQVPSVCKEAHHKVMLSQLIMHN
jgi:hypothetical protein